MKAFRTILAISLGLKLLACTANFQNPSNKDRSFSQTGRAQLDESINTIVGGEIPTKLDLVRKYTVAVVDLDTSGLCSGTIVGKRTVVTAAHCITSRKGTLVLFGDNAYNPNHISSPEKVIFVPGYKKIKNTPPLNAKDLGDVAIIQLEKDIPSTHGIARIAPQSIILRNGDRLLLAGFGAKKDDANSENGTLRKVHVNVLVSRWGQSEFILDQSNQRGSCFGDSGGPAFYYRDADYFLIGITSRSRPGEHDACGGVSIFSHTDYYRDFIQNNLK